MGAKNIKKEKSKSHILVDEIDKTFLNIADRYKSIVQKGINTKITS